MKYTPKELKGNVNVSPSSPIKEFLLLLSVIPGIILLIYIALGLAVDLVVPKLPLEIERKLGRLYSEMYKSAGMTPANKQLQKILDRLVGTMPLKIRPQQELQYRVRIAPNSQINAMALPGGNIVVFSALVKETESENELAFVLAHELGHFANRDHLKGLGRRLVLLVVSAALLGGDSSVTEFLMNSLVNLEMKFSRRQESMADLWALDLLNKSYGHVSGATDFFEKMSKKEKRGRILYYFATHPYPENRIKDLKKWIQEKGYLLKEKIPWNKEIRGAVDSTEKIWSFPYRQAVEFELEKRIS